MSRPYPASAIANYFIEKNRHTPTDLTHLKIQKLLYYAQGWFLANYDEPLFADNIEAWKYGPVVASVYNNLRRFQDKIITEPIKELRYSDGRFQRSSPEVNPTDERVCTFLDLFWDKFSHIEGLQLANMTHKPGTPWDQVVQQFKGGLPENVTIPNEIITLFFKGEMGKGNS